MKFEQSWNILNFPLCEQVGKGVSFEEKQAYPYLIVSSVCNIDPVDLEYFIAHPQLAVPGRGAALGYLGDEEALWALPANTATTSHLTPLIRYGLGSKPNFNTDPDPGKKGFRTRKIFKI